MDEPIVQLAFACGIFYAVMKRAFADLKAHNELAKELRTRQNKLENELDQMKSKVASNDKVIFMIIKKAIEKENDADSSPD